MAEVNYSIRLDEDLREQMRDVPDMPDRIRQFIEQEVERYEEGDQSPTERFCSRVLDDYGLVGAYCLRQLDFHLLRDKYYLQNLEARFADTDVDLEKARLAAKRIRDDWQDLSGVPDEVVEDSLDMEGYLDEFYDHARIVARSAVEENGADVWALWTVVQLFRNVEEQNDRDVSDTSVKERSVALTLRYHGFDDEQIESAISTLVNAGGIQDYYSSNAYNYRYLNFSDYIVDAVEEGLREHNQKIRSRVRDYAEDEPYIDELLDLTGGDETYTYKREISDDTDEDELTRGIQEGTVVLEYRPGRSSTGRRSSLPSRSYAVLSPEIRDVINDAIYRLRAN